MDRQSLSLLAVACALVMVLPAGLSLQTGAGGNQGTGASVTALQDPGAPVAVIAPLPPEVSNGTLWYLDGSGSYPGTPGTSIVNHTWEVFFKTGGTTQYVYARKVYFVFSQLGLYIITLTVTDNLGLRGTAFTAVYSILDSDLDGLPDWWEQYYLGSLSEAGSDDGDLDGWTNLQEYVNGFDPTAEDPRPGLIQDLKDSWYYLVIIAAAVVAAFMLLLPVWKRRRREEEKKKISAAIEIEKALEEE